MLVRLGKLLDGEGKSKKDDIDIGVHDESGALYIKHLPKTWVQIPLTSSPYCCRPQVTSIHGLKDDLFVDNLSKLRELRTRQKHPDNKLSFGLADEMLLRFTMNRSTFWSCLLAGFNYFHLLGSDTQGGLHFVYFSAFGFVSDFLSHM